MSKIEKKEKQNIDNIKQLGQMNESGLVPSLFQQVKRAKQQALNVMASVREQLTTLQRQEEEKFRQEAIKNQAEMMRSQKQSEDEKSFAELLSKGKEKEEKSLQEKPLAPSQTEQESSQKPSLSKEGERVSLQDKPFAEKRQSFENKSTFKSERTSTPNSQSSAPRPYNNFDRAKTYNERPFGSPNNRSFSQNSAGAPNRSGSASPKPYNNFRQEGSRQGASSYAPRRPFSPSGAGGSATDGNRGLSGIMPRRTDSLASASSVFASKERDNSNKKRSTYRSGDDDRRQTRKFFIRRGLIEEQSIEERMVARKLRLKKPKVEMEQVFSAPVSNAVITTPNLTVKILSEKIGKPATEIIKQLMVLGVMTTINSTIDFPTAELVSSEMGVTLELKLEKTFEEKLKEHAKYDDGTNHEKRAPIVTIVGHVDHGKTSLLDYIRQTNVTKGEAGGITQKIGAYSINWKGEHITFVDTPGHEAFINMRKRGTEITDVAILIVAGDDGVKVQTIEAIKEIKKAKVPMIVAITKIDKQNIDIERVKNQLAEQEVLVEEWGGEAIVVPVSSVTGAGIDKLLETILLVAEIQELKCNSKRKAVGTVIEATLDKARGPIANIIVQNGTLRIGDSVVSGFALGKVRALIDDKGKLISKAGPSTPVSVLGLDSVPNAGDSLQVVNEKFSKSVIEERKIKMAQDKIESGAAKSLDEFLATPKQEDKKILNLIIKADTQGSAEALRQNLSEVRNEEVAVEIVASGVGNISENDVRLASVSKATIISFNTKMLAKISNFAKQNKVEIKQFDIIYKAIEDIEAVIKGMMAPKFQEVVSGHAQVRALFKISAIGTIAGCYVLDGKIVRNSTVRVLRGDNTLFEGKIATLKREKNDVKEVASGYECGIKIEGFNDIEVDDILECVVKEQIKD